GLEGLGVDLAEHDLLGEVLRADGDRGLGVVGVALDARGRLLLRRGAGRARVAVVVAAGGQSGDAGQDGQRRPQRPQDAWGGHGWGATLLLGTGNRERRGAPVDVSWRPRGVTARCTAESPSSARTASSATTIAAPRRPASP